MYFGVKAKAKAKFRVMRKKIIIKIGRIIVKTFTNSIVLH